MQYERTATDMEYLVSAFGWGSKWVCSQLFKYANYSFHLRSLNTKKCIASADKNEV